MHDTKLTPAKRQMHVNGCSQKIKQVIDELA